MAARIGQIHCSAIRWLGHLRRHSITRSARKPFRCLAAWEQKVCSSDCTPAPRIALGSFPLAAHTSMRFGDIQRIRVRDISLTQHAVRGSCWATKTTKLGQPSFGFTCGDERSFWVLLWLRSLSIAVTYSATKSPNWQSPDFALPALACINNDEPACFQGPMACSQALALLRSAIPPWMPRTASHLNQDEAQAYTLHSLKVALLSASAQLRLPEESRRQQGHYRLSSVQLARPAGCPSPCFWFCGVLSFLWFWDCPGFWFRVWRHGSHSWESGPV